MTAPPSAGVSLIKRGGLPPRISRSLLLLPLALLTLFNCEELIDFAPPEIEIIEPKGGISYSGTVPCQLDVTDDYKVDRVEVFIDGESVHEFTEGPYTTNLSVSQTGTGYKTFKAVAYDRAGNWADEQREVRIEKWSPSPTTGLVAYYPFNGNANDASGDANHGTVNGATLTADRFGNANRAYSFDGVDDKIALPLTGTGFSNSITIAAWVYRTKSISGHPAMGIVSNDRSGDRGTFLGVAQDDKSYFTVSVPGLDATGFAGSPISQATWTFMVLTYDGSVVNGFIDGELDGNRSVTGDLRGNSTFEIGHHSWDSMIERYWGGLLDDIRIYNRALSEAEIQALYEEGGWDQTIAGDIESFTWTQGAPLPEAAYGILAAEHDGKIYCFGGGPFSAGLSRCRVYDIASDNWSTVSNSGFTPRYVATAVTVGGEIYVVAGYSGYSGMSSVQKYTPQSDTWSTVPSLSNNYGEGKQVGLIGNTIYAIGGHVNNSNFTRVAEKFEVGVDNSWVQLANDVPYDIRYGATIGYQNTIFIFGGYAVSTTYKHVLALDIQTSVWQERNPLPISSDGLGFASAVTIGERIYLIGGSNSVDTKSVIIHEYIPATDTWDSAGELPEPLSHHSAIEYNGKLYIIGGVNSNGELVNTVYIGTPNFGE